MGGPTRAPTPQGPSALSALGSLSRRGLRSLSPRIEQDCFDLCLEARLETRVGAPVRSPSHEVLEPHHGFGGDEIFGRSAREEGAGVESLGYSAKGKHWGRSLYHHSAKMQVIFGKRPVQDSWADPREKLKIPINQQIVLGGSDRRDCRNPRSPCHSFMTLTSSASDVL